MLSAKGLTKTFGEFTAVNALDLEVQNGEIYCMLGANGAGKTTTINLFMGFMKPSSGEARVNDIDVLTHSQETKKHLAYIPESLNLYGNLSGIENLRFFSGLGNTKLDSDSAKELLLSVGLQKSAIEERVSKYSKGMRQKVGIAITKAKKADNLLLDEPTSGLDPQASNEFAKLLQNMREENVAILMATHDLFRAKESGTHIGIMKAGCLIHDLKSEEISLRDLEHLYLETMKSEINV